LIAKATSISIVIPTLNEARYIDRTVTHLRKQARTVADIEILVVDAGSSDGTEDAVQALKVDWISKPEFKLKKYESLNFGLQVATSPIVLFLDADTLLPKHFDETIIAEIEKGCDGGAFEMRFSNADWKLSLLSVLNQIRYRIWKTCYGDQAIFCRKETALKIGGFPRTLMEAAYFSRRLSRIGRFKILRQKVFTSARRFDDHGFWIVLWFDFRVWLRFILGLSLSRHSGSYWEKNVKNG